MHATTRLINEAGELCDRLEQRLADLGGDAEAVGLGQQVREKLSLLREENEKIRHAEESRRSRSKRSDAVTAEPTQKATGLDFGSVPKLEGAPAGLPKGAARGSRAGRKGPQQTSG